MSEDHPNLRKFVVWTAIKNFTPKRLWKYKNVTSVIRSPNFHIPIKNDDTVWYLKCYPNGNTPESAHHMSLFLCRKDFSPLPMQYDVKFTFKIFGQSGVYTEISSSRNINEFDDFGWGYSTILTHETLAKSCRRIVTDGNLQIGCEILITPTESSVALNAFPSFVAEDIEDTIFNEELPVDFEIRCNDGEVLQCHRDILAIRSPVFLAMLTNDMKEANQGFMEVEDFDSAVMKGVLQFVYCGYVGYVGFVSHELIFAAEKYQLHGLKPFCLQSIAKTVTKFNVFEVLLIIDIISGCESLFEPCMRVISRNFFEISKTRDWKQLSKDLLVKIMSRLVFCDVVDYI